MPGDWYVEAYRQRHREDDGELSGRSASERKVASKCLTSEVEPAHCGGAVKVIAGIEDPIVIKKILDHLARRAAAATPGFRPFARAPPQQEISGLKEPG